MLEILTRDNSVPLERRDANPKPATFDATARTIEAVIASTTPVKRRDARGEFLEILDPAGLDLDGTRGVSVLNSHQQEGLQNVIGTVDDVWLKGNKVRARIRFSDRPEVRNYVDDIGAGVINSLSVGYQVDEWRDGVSNGMRTRTAVRWKCCEVSFVPVPADPSARTRSDDNRESTTRAIRELASHAGVSTSLADDLIGRGATIEEARGAMFEDLLTRGATRIVPSRDVQSFDNPDFFRNAVVDGLYCRIDPSHKPSEAGRQFVGMSCVDIARSCLQRSGVNTTGLGADGVITRALMANTTSDFPAIMANVLNKTLRVSYDSAPSGLKAVARQTTNTDFRAKLRIMLDSTGFAVEPVTEAGEYRHGSFVDAFESYAVAPFGKLFNVSRRALINDDLNAFGDISRRLGIACAVFEAQFLVDMLQANSGDGPTMSDTKSLFHADHKNIPDTPATLGVEALSAARLAMRKQTGVGGGLISVTPKFLVVSAALETDAERLLHAISAIKTDDVNPFQNSLQLVVEPRLTDTAWFVVASPSEIDGLEFAHLASQPGPYVESRLGFESDGLECKVRLDFGGGFVDWRGWYRGH